MAAKKSYNRYFIIFQEEDKGYGMGPDRPPTGYAKVETRNEKSKVTVYVQNLKPFEPDECLYKCYLISHQDGKDCSAYLGIMNVDDLGKGESSWETGYENAFDSKIPIDKFNGAAIVAEREGAAGVIAPLAGYMSKEKFDWRSVIPVGKQAQEINDTLEEHAEEEEKVLSEEAAKFQEYEENILETSEVLTEEENVALHDGVGVVETETKDDKSAAQEDTRDMTENIQKTEEPREIQETQEVVEDKAVHSEREDMSTTENADSVGRVDDVKADSRSKHKEHKYEYPCCFNCFKYDFRRILKKMLEDILDDYENTDKHKELKGCRLWKVDMEKYKRDGYKMTMYPCYDLVFYPMMYNPLYDYYRYIRKHGHYLFGIKHDKDGKVAAIIYGIPGRNTASDQPFEGRTGFLKWISWGGDKGYWIMMYDPMTGIIISQK